MPKYEAEIKSEAKIWERLKRQKDVQCQLPLRICKTKPHLDQSITLKT